MPFDHDGGTVREYVGPADTLKIEGRLKRLAADATRDQPRAPHENLWIGGRICDLERCAVDRLLADCELVTLGIGGDRRDLVFDPSEAEASRERQGQDALPITGFTIRQDALLALVGGAMNAERVDESPDLSAFEARALDRAFARTRAENALRAVGEDRWRLLRFLISQATDEALAAEIRIPRSTMRDRLVSGIRALCRHYERANYHRLILPPTRATAPADVVARHYANTGPSVAFTRQ